MKRATLQNDAPATDAISYVGYRSPSSLRMVEELLAARGIELTDETVRRWPVRFGPTYSFYPIGQRRGAVTINGRKHWLWRALDQHGAVLAVPRRLIRKVRQGRSRSSGVTRWRTGRTTVPDDRLDPRLGWTLCC